MENASAPLYPSNLSSLAAASSTTVVWPSSGPTSSPDELASRQCMLLSKLVISSVLSGLVCILGFAANVTSVCVLRADKESPVASFLLQTLAVTDNFFLSFCLVHLSLNDLFTYLGVLRRLHSAWWYIRLYTYPLLFVGQTATIWMTVLIAVSRYIAVCVPYKAAHLCNLARMKLAVALTLTLSLLYNVPRFFEQYVTARVSKRGRVFLTFNHTAMARSPLYSTGYFDVMYYIFSFILPLLLLAFLNTRLIVAYRSIQARRRALRGGPGRRQSRQSEDNNITLVMIVVIVVFMVCNAPARVSQIVWRYQQQKCPTAAFFVDQVSTALEVLNSSTNFIVYCVFKRKFRATLLRRLACLSRLSRLTRRPGGHYEGCSTESREAGTSTNQKYGTDTTAMSELTAV